MTVFRNLLVALALFAGGFAAAPGAQAQTTQEMQQAGAWTAEYQRLVAAFLAPLQTAPQPPVPNMSRARRLSWANATRTWVAAAQATFVTVRTDLRNIPPYPYTPDASVEMRSAIDGAVPRMLESVDAGDRIAGAYLALAGAVERNRTNQISSIRVVALDGALVTMRMFQDINAAQAAALNPGNPNRGLAQSYAYSYEAMWTILNFKRGVALGEDNRLVAANAIASVAQRMRAAVTAGRADASLVQSQLDDPIQASTVNPALLPRLRAMMATFEPSFVREEELAADLEGMAAMLRSDTDYATLEPMFDQRMEVFAVREARHTEDLQARTAIMTAP